MPSNDANGKENRGSFGFEFPRGQAGIGAVQGSRMQSTGKTSQAKGIALTAAVMGKDTGLAEHRMRKGS